jgi:lipoprotein-anchoring transpeptidase ErfK/SrfK
VVDGYRGDNIAKALKGFERANGLEADGELDEESWSKLAATSSEPVLTEYAITEEDVKGPFLDKIPNEMEEMAKLKRLSYTSPRELLAEKFHMDEDLLVALNPGKAFDKAGETIVVAKVRDHRAKGEVSKIEVDKGDRVLRALDKDGKLIAFYPATIGSEEKPAPSGEFKVRAVAKMPTYTYNPDYNFKGVKAKEPFTIPPGPNNPVGSVWIDLTKESYGIHGTPEPSKISKSFSHGCIRLTNWDAEELAELVKKGAAVVFLEEGDASQVTGSTRPAGESVQDSRRGRSGKKE